MSKFIRTIGGCYLNKIGFDLYENKDGSAAIRPCKLTHDFPKKHWLSFASIEDANAAVDAVAGEATGADRVNKLKQAWL